VDQQTGWTLAHLPPDVLELILSHVVHPIELNGVRGPTMVLRDIFAASSACVALRRARAPALVSFTREAVAGDVCAVLHCDWNRLIRSPMTFKALQLREVARALDVRVSGTKSVVAERIRTDAFGLRTPVPPELDVLIARALFLEKKEGAVQVRYKFDRICALFHRYHPTVRDTSFEFKYVYGAAQLRDHVAPHFPTLELLDAELVRLLDVERNYRDIHPPRPQLYCRCGNMAAHACKQKRCYYCCRRQSDLCVRHGVPDSDDSE